MRQIILDTETTGLDPKDGHRVIEIGCIELLDRRQTGNYLHFYFNPDRAMDQGAIEVHGISNDFLKDKPRFYEKAQEILEFVIGAELIIHNASFDLGFLNHELGLLAEKNKWGMLQAHVKVLDTLKMARELHPGQRNSLDALCKRYSVKNTHRQFHGALKDSQILAEVYLAMTGGQINLKLSAEAEAQQSNMNKVAGEVNFQPIQRDFKLKVVRASSEELIRHMEIYK